MSIDAESPLLDYSSNSLAVSYCWTYETTMKTGHMPNRVSFISVSGTALTVMKLSSI